MNRIQANKEAKKIFEEWKKEKNEVEKQAKAEGKCTYYTNTFC